MSSWNRTELSTAMNSWILFQFLAHRWVQLQPVQTWRTATDILPSCDWCLLTTNRLRWVSCSDLSAICLVEGPGMSVSRAVSASQNVPMHKIWKCGKKGRHVCERCIATEGMLNWWILSNTISWLMKSNISRSQDPNPKRYKRTLIYFNTTHSMHIFGVIPFIKPQNDT